MFCQKKSNTSFFYEYLDNLVLGRKKYEKFGQGEFSRFGHSFLEEITKRRRTPNEVKHLIS